MKEDEDKSTKFIGPWEELQLKHNRHGLWYEKDAANIFHILDYSKPITFVSGGFLDDVDRKTELEDNDQERVQDDAHEDDKDGDGDDNDQDTDDDVGVDVDMMMWILMLILLRLIELMIMMM